MKHAVKSILQDLENKNVENRGKLKKKTKKNTCTQNLLFL